MTKISIIIPVYNEENTLEEIVERVYGADIGDIEKEIIVANDGSSDRTSEIVRLLRIKHPGLIDYHSPTNWAKVQQYVRVSPFRLETLSLSRMRNLELDPNDYHALLSVLLNQKASIVYGSRFLASKTKPARMAFLANRFLTILTNFLFGGHLSDMETAYKMFRREVMEGVKLRCVQFDFEPEITAKFLKKGHRILEVPISYHPRTVQKGKKISWIDGYEAIYALIRCRFFSHE